MRSQLSNDARLELERKVDAMFDRLLAGYIGVEYAPDKIISFKVVRDQVLSLPGVFQSALVETGVDENSAKDTLISLARIATNYINGVREQAKARMVHAVDNALARTDEEAEDQVMDELRGQLSSVMIRATSDVKRILETETTNARNEATHEAISRMSTSVGISDPQVMKIVVNDDVLCKTCKALWLMPDGVTPRLYYKSELHHGYMSHKCPQATIGSTHPNCRCTLTFLMPGYGFDGSGSISWVGEGHIEIKNQRGA